MSKEQLAGPVEEMRRTPATSDAVLLAILIGKYTQRLAAILATLPEPGVVTECYVHSWHDYGTVPRAWCPRCNAVAVVGHEDHPYGVLSVTDDGEYRTSPIQRPAAVDEALDRMRQAPPNLWRADLIGQQISVERMRDILAFALAAQPGGSDDR